MDHAQIKTTAVLGILTALFGILISHANAKSPCRPGGVADQHLTKIKKNQTILAKTRTEKEKVVSSVTAGTKLKGDVKAYDKFVEAKEWNRLEVAAIEKEGCSVD